MSGFRPSDHLAGGTGLGPLFLELAHCQYARTFEVGRARWVDRRRPETAALVRRALLFARSRATNGQGWAAFPWLAPRCPQQDRPSGRRAEVHPCNG